MLRFTIRDVLWLTLVVGLAVGWWVDRDRRATENRELAEYGRAQASRASAAEGQIQLWEDLGFSFVPTTGVSAPP